MGNLNLGRLTWAIARLVMAGKTPRQGVKGQVEMQTNHDNPLERATFPESICYNPARWPGGPVARWPGGPVARWPGGRVVPLASVGSGHEGCPMAALGPPSFLPA